MCVNKNYPESRIYSLNSAFYFSSELLILLEILQKAMTTNTDNTMVESIANVTAIMAAIIKKPSNLQQAGGLHFPIN